MPRWSSFFRERVVSFDQLALSDMLTCTVRMSPTRRARWSRKKPLAPERQSELAPALCSGSGSGIGSDTGW